MNLVSNLTNPQTTFETLDRHVNDTIGQSNYGALPLLAHFTLTSRISKYIRTVIVII